MHRALLIPEIVAQIIDYHRFDGRCLYNFLFISPLFFYSSARILWSECGIRSSTKSHSTPYIRHLVHIARQDAHRGQVYAALIRRLQVRDTVVTEGKDGGELAYLEELSGFNLKWTSLEEVDALQSDCWTKELLGPLMQCLQPRLRILSLNHTSIMGDEFLETLAKRCPGLECLALKPYFGRGGITTNGLAGFLKKCNLESINFRAEEDSWGVDLEKEIFEVLHKQRKLRHISIPDISTSILESIANTRMPGAKALFSALKSLCTGLPVSALGALHSVAPHLSSLSLDLSRVSPLATTSALSTLSIFSSLSEIDIVYHIESEIHGHELVHLAQNCPFLVKLSINKDEQIPRSLDINDSDIEAFAQNATQLKELYLVFHVPVDIRAWELYPTERALESLARHCNRLERLWLTSYLDWGHLTKHPLNVLFPDLWDLYIDGPEMTLSFVEVESRESAQKMAADLVERLPNLTKFRFSEKYGEWPWDEMFRDIIRARCCGAAVTDFSISDHVIYSPW